MSNKTSAKTAGAGPQNGAPRFFAKQKSGGEVRPDKINPIVLKQSQDVGECLVVAIVPVSGFTEQFTIHRPIGVTDLEKDDWVVSPTSEVHQLVARAKDPAQGKNDEIRRSNERHFLVAKGLLEVVDNKAFYPGIRDKTRRDFLDDAEKAMKAARKLDKSAKQLISLYMVGHAKEGEEKIAEAKRQSDFLLAVENGVDRSYRTRGGVLEDKVQQGAPGLKGKSMRELPTFTAKVLMKTLGLGEQMEITVAQGDNASSSESSEIDALRETIEELRDHDAQWVAHFDVVHTHADSVGQILTALKEMFDAKDLAPDILALQALVNNACGAHKELMDSIQKEEDF